MSGKIIFTFKTFLDMLISKKEIKKNDVVCLQIRQLFIKV